MKLKENFKFALATHCWQPAYIRPPSLGKNRRFDQLFLLGLDATYRRVSKVMSEHTELSEGDYGVLARLSLLGDGTSFDEDGKAQTCVEEFITLSRLLS